MPYPGHATILTILSSKAGREDGVASDSKSGDTWARALDSDKKRVRIITETRIFMPILPKKTFRPKIGIHEHPLRIVEG
jgi:hypothetical protein